MTHQGDQAQNNPEQEQQPEAPALEASAAGSTGRPTPADIPKITKEQDAPFPVRALTETPARTSIDGNLNQTDNLDREITRFRYKTGRKVLYISMIAMCVAVAADLFATAALKVQSNLISNAFEAFKLITMTVLGYIFGSSGSSGTKSN